MVDYARLAMSTQAYRLRFDVEAPRAFRVSDVNWDGTDTDHDYPPAADPIVALPIISGFDGVSDVGRVAGSVAAGGWTASLTIPEIPAEFNTGFGVSLWVETWHGNIPGVVGASGIDPDFVRIFKGFFKRDDTAISRQRRQVVYPCASSDAFLRAASTSRGIDHLPGLFHDAGSARGIIDELIDQHTNLKPRSVVGIYVPDHVVNGFALNRGPLYAMLKQVADNFCLIGWVFCDREDNLQVVGHPNMVGPENYLDTRLRGLSDPAIDFNDDIVLEWDIGEPLDENRCAQCTITVEHSDQTQDTVNYYTDSGVGSRDTFTIRSDDMGIANTLAARYVRHANRPLDNIRCRVPLNVVTDLGYAVTCSTDKRYNNRGVTLYQAPAVVTGVEYTIDLQKGQFSSWVTMDQVVV
jgi:hypothetical protein